MSEHALEKALVELFGPGTRIIGTRPEGGGCISRASTVLLSNGQSVFLKENSGASPGFFRAEADGLAALEAVHALRVAKPLYVYEQRDLQFLILEHIEQGSRSARFWEALGHGLAALHRAPCGRLYGFPKSNFIGSTEQENGMFPEWTVFFGERRLSAQLRLAESRALLDGSTVVGVRSIIGRLPELLGATHRPSLLHGDLWGGNVMVGSDGNPVLIDPAAYVGDREADLAMTELFGGFDARFYAAYSESWPLEPGFERRREIYNLYHLLNHLNLFGGSYEGSVRRVVERFAA